jgi:hypothetical protein
VDRRDAIRRLAAGSIGTAVGPQWVERLLASARTRTAGQQGQTRPGIEQALKPWTPRALTVQQNAAVMAITELIIPATDTPGATAAKVNEYIDAILDDADDAERREFLGGLAWMDARSRELFGAEFVSCAPEQQVALLTIVSSGKNTALEDQTGVAFFEAIKGLTITGYYNSAVGMREELGDGGIMAFDDDPGCQHAEHQKPGIRQ